MIGRRPSPLLLRLPALVAALVFAFSVVTAQLAYCQCGITCLHLPGGATHEAPPPPESAPHPCCPTEGSHGAPKPHCGPDRTGHHGDGEACPCPVEASNSDRDVPLAPVPAGVASLRDITKAELALLAPPVVEPLRAGLEDSTAWRPARGSPPSSVPKHLLHSIFII